MGALSLSLPSLYHFLPFWFLPPPSLYPLLLCKESQRNLGRFNWLNLFQLPFCLKDGSW
jgi:hypothetical protein